MTSHQWQLAHLMWRAGYDTLHIAHSFKVSEWLVYNGLAKRRERTRL